GFAANRGSGTGAEETREPFGSRFVFVADEVTGDGNALARLNNLDAQNLRAQLSALCLVLFGENLCALPDVLLYIVLAAGRSFLGGQVLTATEGSDDSAKF